MLIIAAVRLVYAIILYTRLSSEGKITDWLSLFMNWDSRYYLGIAAAGYPAHNSPYWAFFPVYPALIRIVHFSNADLFFCAFIVSTMFGLLSIPLFQKVSNNYLTPTLAFQSTLVYFLVTPVFVFSAVDYAEPLLLFFALLSWQLHLHDRNFPAAISVALCTLTKPDGFLIMIPIAYDGLKSKDFKKLGWLLVPICTLAGWLYYGYLMTGGLIPSVAWRFWRTESIIKIEEGVVDLLRGNLAAIQGLMPYSSLIVVSACFLVITIVLLMRVRKIDHSLFLYSSIVVVAILVAGWSIAFRSFPRLAGSIFPLGFTLHTKKMWLLAIAIVALLILDYLGWNAFLTDGFF